MDFTLAHGTANDFIVVPDLEDRYELPVALVRALCDRRQGIGADGILRIAPGEAGAGIFMDHRNADGSSPEMCGNGIRVVAKYVLDRGLATPDDHGVVHIATRAGVKAVTARRGDDGRVSEVTVDMGAPVLAPAEVPFETDDAAAVVQTVDLDDGRRIPIGVVSMGNPHGVLCVDDVGTAPVGDLGPLLESHARFPAKANIGFARVLDTTSIDLRVWERGVGETAACGTGACAAVVALQRQELLGPEVQVHLPGGTLTIRHEPGGTVHMTGPAVEVATGHIDTDWLAHADRDHIDPR
ncbi:MAG: diaminopimelate epimerase [Nitriliruptor sp.]|nr:MAG: diaminopimelate epimerase [Nitriliruptor sp.]